MAKRWIVGRILSRLNWSRRLSKDYEIAISSEEAMIKISHFHTLIKLMNTDSEKIFTLQKNRQKTYFCEKIL